MLDFGFSELLLIGVIALVVLGPERLPKAARAAGNLLGRVQRMISSVKEELSAHADMEEWRKAKSEFESTAEQIRGEIANIGSAARQDFHKISDGLSVPVWERVPEQRTPADFGLDENGAPLQDASEEAQWDDYEMPSEKENNANRNYSYGNSFHTASIRKQAIRRKRNARPRQRPQPQLRVRKK